MDESDTALQVDMLAAALRMDGRESAQLMEFLAQKFQGALPDNVEVTRGGWMLAKEKPVKEILLRFEEFHYQLTKDKNSPVVAKQLKVVRGVALKSNEVTYDQWIQLVAEEMAKLAERNAQARAALNKMVQ